MLADIRLSAEASEQLLTAIETLQSSHAQLRDIDLHHTGGYPDNLNFSDSVKGKIRKLKLKSICVAETVQEHEQMTDRLLRK